jgi:hypothetical protein
MYPRSICGRLIAVGCGLFGVFCTALLVAVINKKLQFTRSEKFVYQFVREIEMAKKVKIASSNVVKNCWRLYKIQTKLSSALVNSDISDESKRLLIKQARETAVSKQRNLLHSIREVRELKEEQRNLIDASESRIDIYQQNEETNNILKQLNIVTNNLEEKVNSLDKKLETIYDIVSNKKRI